MINYEQQYKVIDGEELYVYEVITKRKLRPLPEVLESLQNIYTSESYVYCMMHALVLFDAQEYKKAFIKTYEMVLLAKGIFEAATKEKDVSAQREAKFILGIANLLRARIELVFLQARRKSIVLKEDFTESEKSKFTIEYWTQKTLKHSDQSKDYVGSNIFETEKLLPAILKDL